MLFRSDLNNLIQWCVNNGMSLSVIHPWIRGLAPSYCLTQSKNGFLWHLLRYNPHLLYLRRLFTRRATYVVNIIKLLDIQLFQLLINLIDCSQPVERILHKVPSRYTSSHVTTTKCSFRLGCLFSNTSSLKLCNSHIEVDITFDSLLKIRSRTWTC